MKTLLRMAVLAALALCAGFAVNQIHPQGIHGNLLINSFSTGYQWRRITADSAFSLFNKQDAVFIDIRSEKEFLVDHIPGALSQPFHPFFRNFSRFEKDNPKQKTFVLYCFEPACREGHSMLRLMKTRGYQKAVWMYGGLSRWIEKSYPLENGRPM